MTGSIDSPHQNTNTTSNYNYNPPPEQGPTPAHLKQQYGGDIELHNDQCHIDANDIELMNSYPPGSTSPESDKIQFNEDGTAYIWTKDPTLDPNGPTGQYAVSSWIGANGEIHHLSRADYDAVSNGTKTMADIVKAHVPAK
ncbi:MAG TPA: hypothetical protein VEC35_25620 [Noviherbaspirillum sp.]|nr:hypothetical protein [Noviherbaspirillum sp.]